jgi:hypothetical protein
MSGSDNGIATPENMRSLKRVFDDLCEDHQIDQSSSDGEVLAKAVMSLFTVGMDDADELQASLTEFMDRRS